MKWVSLFKQKRSKTEDRGNSAAEEEEEEEEEHGSKRRMVALEGGAMHTAHTTQRCRRHSLDTWFEARSARTACDVNTTTTTENLQVCKAGSTTLINSKYVVIKHLGTGSYGQVKLAFNLMDKKLYAIKACKKSQLGCPSWSHAAVKRNRSNRFSSSGFGSARSLRRTSQGEHLTCGQLSKQSMASVPGSVEGMMLASRPNRRAISAPQQHTPPYPSASFSIPRISGAAQSSMSPPRQDCQPQPSPSGISAIPEHCAAEHSQQQAPQQQQRQQQQRQQQQDLGLQSMAVAMADVAHHIASPSIFGMQQAFEQYKAENFVREITIMKKLSHPNIVKLVEVIDDPSSDNLLLVMEYVEGKTLQSRQINSTTWEPESEIEAWRRARDVLQGLDYLHSHEVVHGDLKPANLILDSNTHKVKIVDFGSAVLHSRSPGTSGTHASVMLASMMGPGTMACTPAFRSPESLQQSYRLSYELDMWALGVTIYLWVFGHLPFSGGAPFIVYENIRKQPVQLPADRPVSAELTSFLLMLLEKDPVKRLDVRAAIAHPWVTACGVAPLAAPVPAAVAAGVGSPPVLERSSKGSETGPEAPAAAPGAELQQEPEAQPRVVARCASCKQSQEQGKEPYVLAGHLSAGGMVRLPSPKGMNLGSATEVLDCLSGGAADEAGAAPSNSGSVDGMPGPSGSSCRNYCWSLEGVVAVLENDQQQTSERQHAADIMMSCEVTSRSRSMTDAAGPRHRPSGSGLGLSATLSGPGPGLSAPLVAPGPSGSGLGLAVVPAGPGSGSCTPEVPPGPSASFSEIGSAGVWRRVNGEEPSALPMPPPALGAHRRLPSRCDEASPLPAPAGGVGRGHVERGRVTRGSSRAQLVQSIRPEEVAQAITRCRVSAEEVVGLVFEEVRFMPRQQIITAGDPMSHVYLIIKGEVEMSVALPAGFSADSGSHCSRGGSPSALGSPIISGLDSQQSCVQGGCGGRGGHHEDEEEVMMDFLQVNHDDCMRLERDEDSWTGHLNVESEASRLLVARPGLGPPSELVLTVKGPGDSLGVVHPQPRSHESQPTWRANVRAKGEVVALRAEVAGLQRLAQLRPELTSAVNSFAGQQQTDHQVVEALRQLHASHMSQQWQLRAASRPAEVEHAAEAPAAAEHAAGS